MGEGTRLNNIQDDGGRYREWLQKLKGLLATQCTLGLAVFRLGMAGRGRENGALPGGRHCRPWESRLLRKPGGARVPLCRKRGSLSLL